MKRKPGEDGWDEAAKAELPILPSLPDDAPLNDVIDQRFRQLFTLCTDPKDLTAALKAATDWVKVKTEQEAGGQWGTKLGAGTMR